MAKYVTQPDPIPELQSLPWPLGAAPALTCKHYTVEQTSLITLDMWELLNLPYGKQTSRPAKSVYERQSSVFNMSSLFAPSTSHSMSTS